MRIPEPYFKNVLSYGDLSMEEILLEDIYPVLFILKNSKQQRFLCVCCEIRDEQRWIINRITNLDAVSFLRNQITARDLFEKGQSQIVAIRDYTTKEEHFVATGMSELDSRDLPRAGVYLDAEAGEFFEYTQKLTVSDVECDDIKEVLLYDKKALMQFFDVRKTIPVNPTASTAIPWVGSKIIFKGEMRYA